MVCDGNEELATLVEQGFRALNKHALHQYDTICIAGYGLDDTWLQVIHIDERPGSQDTQVWVVAALLQDT
jgi:hypothetical protein